MMMDMIGTGSHLRLRHRIGGIRISRIRIGRMLLLRSRGNRSERLGLWRSFERGWLEAFRVLGIEGAASIS
jgi:hypothetical protein